MSTQSSGKDPSREKWEADRVAALYDPDTVYRAGVAETPAEHLPAPAPQPEDSATSPLYAKRERRRAPQAMTPEMIRRIADRTEMNAAKRRGGGKDE